MSNKAVPYRHEYMPAPSRLLNDIYFHL